MLFWFEVVCKPASNRRTSMSDWLLYHVWGIRGYRVVGQEKISAEMAVLMIEPLPSTIRCPQCGSAEVVRKGTKLRLFLATPIGRRRVYFEAQIPRVRCDHCGITRQV